MKYWGDESNLFNLDDCYIITEGFFLYNHFSLVISYHSAWLGLELFGFVHVQLNTLSTVHARARRM